MQVTIDWYVNDIWGYGQNRSFEKVKTNGKALEVSIEMNWTLKGSKLLKGTN